MILTKNVRDQSQIMHLAKQFAPYRETYVVQSFMDVWDHSQITFAILLNFRPTIYLTVCSLVLESLQFFNIFDHPPTYDHKRNL